MEDTNLGFRGGPIISVEKQKLCKFYISHLPECKRGGLLWRSWRKQQQPKGTWLTFHCVRAQTVWFFPISLCTRGVFREAVETAMRACGLYLKRGIYSKYGELRGFCLCSVSVPPHSGFIQWRLCFSNLVWGPFLAEDSLLSFLPGVMETCLPGPGNRGPSSVWEMAPLCLASDRLHGLCFQKHEILLPGLKTIIKTYSNKPQSPLLLTLAVRYKAPTKRGIQKFCLPGLFPSYRTTLNLVGLFFHVFLMRKYFRDYWHHRFISFWQFSLLTNCNLWDLFSIFLSQYGPHLINLL